MGEQQPSGLPEALAVQGEVDSGERRRGYQTSFQLLSLSRPEGLEQVVSWALVAIGRKGVGQAVECTHVAVY